jgi:hypothetical protein
VGRSSKKDYTHDTTLPLESVDDVERGDGLSLGVLGVSDGVTNGVLEEDLFTDKREDGGLVPRKRMERRCKPGRSVRLSAMS